jgi:hypothetical protein
MPRPVNPRRLFQANWTCLISGQNVSALPIVKDPKQFYSGLVVQCPLKNSSHPIPSFVSIRFFSPRVCTPVCRYTVGARYDKVPVCAKPLHNRYPSFSFSSSSSTPTGKRDKLSVCTSVSTSDLSKVQVPPAYIRTWVYYYLSVGMIHNDSSCMWRFYVPTASVIYM